MLYKYHGWFQHITDGMEEFLERLNQRVVVGLVGGSDLKKINEQMSGKGNVTRTSMIYLFAAYLLIFDGYQIANTHVRSGVKILAINVTNCSDT